MSQRPPFVSILIPAAGERFFAHALASACSQRYPLLEIVVCDDSPGDAVRDAVAAALDPRVRYLRNPVPLGRCGAFTRCLSAARGAYVKFLDDSDRLLPGCVETLAGMLDNPAVRLATSRRLLIDAAGAPRPDPAANVPVSRVSALVRGRELGELALLGGSNLIGGPAATMFRRADLAIEAEDAFRWGGRSYRCLADLGMWLRLLSRGLAYYHAEPLSEHRIHDCGEPRGLDIECLHERLWIARQSRAEGFLSSAAKWRKVMEEVLGRVRARDLHAVDAGTRSRVARLEAELEAELAVAVGVEIAALGGPI